MEFEELRRLEQALEIKLPLLYHQAVNPFPIEAYRGNSETSFWDDASQLIALNLELRQQYAWPSRFFALGRDAGGCCDGIDLDDPAWPVYWFEHRIFDLRQAPKPETLEHWLVRQADELRYDLLSDGYNPDASPESFHQAQNRQVYEDARLLWILVVGGGVVLLLVWLGLSFNIHRT